MKFYLVKNKFRGKVGGVVREIQQGQVIHLPEQIADVLLRAGKIKFHSDEPDPVWRNSYPVNTEEAWRESIAEVMDALILEAWQFIQTQRRYTYDEQMKAVENYVTDVYRDVLNKRLRLSDFRSALAEWKKRLH